MDYTTNKIVAGKFDTKYFTFSPGNFMILPENSQRNQQFDEKKSVKFAI